MNVARRFFSSASSLIGKELYQEETVVRLILKDARRRNALSLDMIEELNKELESLNGIQKVRSVIISSEGPAFSSGHDLRELTSYRSRDKPIALRGLRQHYMQHDRLATYAPSSVCRAAVRCGLVSRVVPDEDVKSEALKVAEQIGRHSRSVTAVGKAFFYSQVELGVTDAYRHGNKVMTENLKMKDTQEGISAFTEKRKPNFTHTDEKCM